MNSEWFEKVIKQQIKTCEDVLIGKAKEYATDDDRLHNFKNAAGMMSCDPKEALAGMMAKHTISVYDMCRSGKDYPIELWNEKITDHINYLLLLKAIVEEEKRYGRYNKITVDSILDEMRKFEDEPEEEPYFTLAYGEVPTFNGKPVEIKKQDVLVDKVMKGLIICVDGDCHDCPYNDEYCGDCTDNLKKDAAELLKKYKSIIGDSASKSKDDAPKIKEDPKALDEAIHRFRETIEHCANAECRDCDYYYLDKINWRKCSKSLLDEFDNIMARLKEEHHDNT